MNWNELTCTSINLIIAAFAMGVVVDCAMLGLSGVPD